MAISGIGDSPEFRAALGKGIKALNQLASYELGEGIQNRMRDLGERKEHLSDAEYSELQDLVSFAQKRQIEKLEAKVALKDLGKFMPDQLAS